MLTALMMWIAAATQPLPVSPPENWVDYPPSSFRNGAQGVVRYEASVGKDGKVTACVVTASSGFAYLDSATCLQIVRRGRFRPAADETGNPIPGIYRGNINWSLEPM